MFYLKCLLIACIIAGLAGCSKKEEEISADEILNNIDSAKSPGVKPQKQEKFSEPENLATGKKKATAKTSAPISTDINFTPSFTEGGRFVVQCNVFASAKAAKRLADKLTEKSYPAYVAEVENPKPDMGGMFYRVRVGNFSGISRARDFGENVLVAMGYEYWIDNKSNDNIGKGGSSSYMGGSSNSSTSYESSTPSYQSTPSYSSPAPEPVPAVTPAAPVAPSNSNDMGSGTSSGSNSGYDNTPYQSTPATNEPAPVPQTVSPKPGDSGTGQQPATKSSDQNFDF